MAIRDNQQIKEIEEQLQIFNGLIHFPFLLRALGFSSQAITEIAASVTDMSTSARQIIETPDRFNEEFGDHGWIAFEYARPDEMEAAILIKNDQGLEAAETYLEERWNEDNRLQFFLRRLCAHPGIQERRELILAAYDDHTAGRYHSSVLVTLAQIDGIAHDFWKNKKGFGISFFQKNTDHLQTEDTIAGAESGLPRLARMLSEDGSRTIATPLNIPYRHRILHGRALGYATRRNSTKAILALIALEVLVRKRLESGFIPEFIEHEATSSQKKPPSHYTSIEEAILQPGLKIHGEIAVENSDTTPVLIVKPFVFVTEGEENIERTTRMAVLQSIYRPFIHTDIESIEVIVEPILCDSLEKTETPLVSHRRGVRISRAEALDIARELLGSASFDDLVGEVRGEEYYCDGWSKRFTQGYYGDDRSPGLTKHYETLMSRHEIPA